MSGTHWTKPHREAADAADDATAALLTATEKMLAAGRTQSARLFLRMAQTAARHRHGLPGAAQTDGERAAA